MKPATQPRRPVVDARAAVLRCLRVALAGMRAGAWGLELDAHPANDTSPTKPNAPPR